MEQGVGQVGKLGTALLLEKNTSQAHIYSPSGHSSQTFISLFIPILYPHTCTACTLLLLLI